MHDGQHKKNCKILNSSSCWTAPTVWGVFDTQYIQYRTLQKKSQLTKYHTYKTYSGSGWFPTYHSIMINWPRPISACIKKFWCGKNWACVFTTTHQLPLPLYYCETSSLPCVASVTQRTGWKVQNHPVKQLQQLLCLTSAVWGCIVMLSSTPHDRSSVWVAEATFGRKRKWKRLLVNASACESVISTVRATLKNNTNSVEQMTKINTVTTSHLIFRAYGTLLIEHVLYHFTVKEKMEAVVLPASVQTCIKFQSPFILRNVGRDVAKRFSSPRLNILQLQVLCHEGCNVQLAWCCFRDVSIPHMIPCHCFQPRVSKLRCGSVRVCQTVLQVNKHFRVMVVLAHLCRCHQDSSNTFRQVFYFSWES